MKIKIVSDGTPYGVRVVDEEGEELQNKITSIKWEALSGDMPTVTMEFIDMDIDVVGEVKEEEKKNKEGFDLEKTLWEISDKIFQQNDDLIDKSGHWTTCEGKAE